jgi:hypothetical protein
MNTGALNDEVQHIPSQGIPAKQLSPALQTADLACSSLSTWEIAEYCKWEIRTSRGADSCNDSYTLELFRRAAVQSDRDARECLEHCLDETLRNWLYRHPRREEACHFASEEQYLAQALERFWQVTAFNRQVEFSTLATALHLLRACLNGAILDTLRASARLRKISRPVLGEPPVEDVTSSSEVWDTLKTLLSDPREVRLAYLLFRCGMGPREIVHVCPHEFDDAREVYALWCTIIERLLCHADLCAPAAHTYKEAQ